MLLVLIWVSASDAVKIANDPSRLIVGARILGLGGAFSAIADDTGAIFINPAGLGKAENWEISSMSGKFINIFDYVQVSSVYPTRFGNFGLGYGGSLINFSFPSTEVIVIGDETRIVPSGEVSGKYGNTALFLSYGKGFDLFRRKIYLGAALKILSEQLSATSIQGGTASGYDLNFGALYPANEYLSLALTAHNILSSDMGGRVKWDTGTEEILPSYLKFGLAYKILKRDWSEKSNEHELLLTADYDYYLKPAAAARRTGMVPDRISFVKGGAGPEFIRRPKRQSNCFERQVFRLEFSPGRIQV